MVSEMGIKFILEYLRGGKSKEGSNKLSVKIHEKSSLVKQTSNIPSINFR